MNPTMMLAIAHHGVASGEPMYAIYTYVSISIDRPRNGEPTCAQSKVKMDIPMPCEYPNIWLRGALLGAIQQTQVK